RREQDDVRDGGRRRAAAVAGGRRSAVLRAPPRPARGGGRRPRRRRSGRSPLGDRLQLLHGARLLRDRQRIGAHARAVGAPLAPLARGVRRLRLPRARLHAAVAVRPRGHGRARGRRARVRGPEVATLIESSRRGGYGGPVIEARGLTKVYGEKRAVDDLSFSVRPGIVTGFLGPN